MSIPFDPNTDKAKMLALLALLDVLEGSAEMTTVGCDRVGHNDVHGRGGKLRLKFTVFGNETRLLSLAHDLTQAGSHQAMMRQLEARLDRDEKLRFAASMIETWTAVLQRLLAEPKPAPLPESIARAEARLGVDDVNPYRFVNRTVRKLPEGKP